jgi:hypothetical protein
LSPHKELPQLSKNAACPTHGLATVSLINGRLVCFLCDWSKLYDHRDVLTPRAKPTRTR